MGITEVLLSTNSFRKPEVKKDNEALLILITRLIMLEPGSIIGLPIEAGIGLSTKYRYCIEDDLPNLKNEIERQVSIYIPDGQGAEISCEFRKTGSLADRKILIIGVRLGSDIYAIGTDGESVYQSVEGDTTLSTTSLQSLLEQ